MKTLSPQVSIPSPCSQRTTLPPSIQEASVFAEETEPQTWGYQLKKS